MFDRTVVMPQHVTREVTKHVHEHRAPTDESVRLLKEMETAAKERVVEAVHVGDTTFECVVHVEKTFHDDNVRLLAVFSLNGKKLTAEHIDRSDRFERYKAFAELRDAIAREIATHILVPALRGLDGRLLGPK